MVGQHSQCIFKSPTGSSYQTTSAARVDGVAETYDGIRCGGHKEGAAGDSGSTAKVILRVLTEGSSVETTPEARATWEREIRLLRRLSAVYPNATAGGRSNDGSSSGVPHVVSMVEEVFRMQKKPLTSRVLVLAPNPETSLIGRIKNVEWGRLAPYAPATALRWCSEIARGLTVLEEADLFFSRLNLNNVMLAGSTDPDKCSVYLTGFDVAATDAGPSGPPGLGLITGRRGTFDSRSGALDLGRVMFMVLMAKVDAGDIVASQISSNSIMDVPWPAYAVLQGLLRPRPSTRLPVRLAAARLRALVLGEEKEGTAEGKGEGEAATVAPLQIVPEEEAWWKAVEDVDDSDGGTHESKVSRSRDDVEVALVKASLALGAYWDGQRNKAYKAMEIYGDTIEHANRGGETLRDHLGEAYSRLADTCIRSGRHEVAREVLELLRGLQLEDLRRIAVTAGSEVDDDTATPATSSAASSSISSSSSSSASSSPAASVSKKSGDAVAKAAAVVVANTTNVQQQSPTPEDDLRFRLAATCDLLGLTCLALGERERSRGQEGSSQQELQRALGEFVRAEKELSRVPTDESTAQLYKVRAHKAAVYRIKGAYDRALRAIEEVMDARRRVVSKNDPEIATYLVSMARVFAKKGDTDVAIQMLTKAHEKLMASMSEEGTPKPDPLLVADTRTRLGDLFRAKKQPQESLGWYQLALEMKESNLPAFHPELGTSYHAIGLFFEDSKEYANAAIVYKKALKIRRVALPPDALETAATLHRLAVVAHCLKEQQAALTYYQEAQAILNKWGPSLELADLMWSMSALRQTEGDLSGALICLYSAETVYKQMDLPDRDPRVVAILSRIDDLQARHAAQINGDDADDLDMHDQHMPTREERLKANAFRSEIRAPECDEYCVIQ